MMVTSFFSREKKEAKKSGMEGATSVEVCGAYCAGAPMQ